MQNATIIVVTFLIITVSITAFLALLAMLLLLHNRHERELLRVKLELQEEHLAHIGREIHDNINQYLYAAKLYLERLSAELSESQRQDVQSAVEFIGKAFADLRELSQKFGAATIREAGLLAAIEKQVALLRANAYAVDFVHLGRYSYGNEEREIILFRIVQEAVTNIIRHSGAKAVKIVVDCSAAGVLHLVLEDDGVGFDRSSPGVADRKAGGIQNMISRAGVLGADFSLESLPGAGTRLRIYVPKMEANGK